MRLKFSCFLLFLALSPLAAFSQTADHVKVELLSETVDLNPGKPVTLGIHFTLDKGWHIYWKNPGDAGLATSVSWELPAGFKAGKILWPTPQVLPFPSVTDFGYENETLLMVPITVPKNLKPGDLLKFSAKVQWLVCNQICIPGEADLQLELTVVSGVPSKITDNQLFLTARQNLPARLPASWKASGTLDSKQFVLTFQTPTSCSGAFFFPSTPIQIDNNAPQNFEAAGSGFTLTVKRSDQLTADVQKLAGVLVVKSADGKQTGYE
ncbi:MAG TPA: protein-disulfide reductase DsbD domain-containing protein, partial [bacterium]|nr:protein-disulfide reductase DsbD domain-containing protein [bacterium]